MSLSSFETKMWSLTYECLRRFGCPVVHRVRGPDVPRRFDQYIRFLVPCDHPQAGEVVNFLRDELRSEIRSSGHDGDHWLWGVYVEVSLFNGIEPYLEHEIVEQMAHDFAKDLMRRLTRTTQ